MSREHDHQSSAESKGSTALDKRDVVTVSALISYAAHNQRVKESAVEKLVTEHFGINSINELPRRSFEEAIRFLVDTQIDVMQK